MRSNDELMLADVWHSVAVMALVAILLIGALIGTTRAQAPDSTGAIEDPVFDSIWPDLDSMEQYWWDGWAQRNGWDPMTEMLEMDDRVRDMFDQSNFGFRPGEMIGHVPELKDVQLTDEGDHFRIVVEAEDLEESSLDIEVHQGTLVIHGEHESFVEHQDASGHITRKYRASRSFSRIVSLPEPVEPDEMTADYTDGVLTITLPKETT